VPLQQSMGQQQVVSTAVRARPGDRPLAGKVALVTGGGRGLGAAICEVLAGAGASVVVADVREDLASESAQAIVAAGGTARPVGVDVADVDAVGRAVDELLATEGRLDILVNNAAMDITLPVDEISAADWDREVDVNLHAPFYLMQRAFKLMKAQDGGSIVNITSTAAKRAWANASAYHASKWGLLGLSHALHVEGRPYDIKVTALISGGMRTPFLLDRFPDIDTGTLQDPHNVADAVLFVLTRPPEAVVPELTIMPMTETSWP